MVSGQWPIILLCLLLHVFLGLFFVPTRELPSRAAPGVEAHHHVKKGPDTGRNSVGRRTIKEKMVYRKISKNTVTCFHVLSSPFLLKFPSFIKGNINLKKGLWSINKIYVLHVLSNWLFYFFKFNTSSLYFEQDRVQTDFNIKVNKTFLWWGYAGKGYVANA